MKNLCQIALSCLFLFGLSCTDEDDFITTEIEEATSFPAFKALALDDEQIYHVEFDSVGQSAMYTNLTLTQGVPRNLEFVHRQKGNFGLYRVQNVWLHNAVENHTQDFLDYTTPGNTEQREGVVNDDLHIALLFRYASSLSILRLRIINGQNNVQQLIDFGDFDGNTNHYLYKNYVVVVLEPSGATHSEVYVIDIALGAIVTQFNYDSSFQGLAFGDSNDFYLFMGDATMNRYDFASFDLLESNTTTFEALDREAYFVQDRKIYTFFNYLQPSNYLRGGFVYNLNTGSQTNIDLARGFEQFKNSKEGVTLLSNADFVYNSITDSWLCNYTLQFSEGSEEYGVLEIANDGSLKNQVTLDIFPWKVVAALYD